MNIEPGTPVIVTIKGTAERKSGFAGQFILVTTPGDSAATLEPDDPAVQITPVDPERPKLDREALIDEVQGIVVGGRGSYYSVPIDRDAATQAVDAILALIEAAHPGLIR